MVSGQSACDPGGTTRGTTCGTKCKRALGRGTKLYMQRTSEAERARKNKIEAERARKNKMEQDGRYDLIRLQAKARSYYVVIRSA